ncbi:Uu.00g098940.m01.CDS01 [Anthostomella pinea]|uniref:Uu.00g098940.m01.CDS01 n=1 Tax=Anthostomella pinea TaxID=933095 RepID=A0AAI8YF61_9PEZI|nr:Uu.00g098940.m01.CDS01 [Anthostomella pinea]
MSAATSAARAAARLRTPKVSAFRQFIHSIEPATTSPRPSFGGSQPGNWGRLLKARAGVAALYIPGMGLVLGWPVIAREMINGHM